MRNSHHRAEYKVKSRNAICIKTSRFGAHLNMTSTPVLHTSAGLHLDRLGASLDER